MIKINKKILSNMLQQKVTSIERVDKNYIYYQTKKNYPKRLEIDYFIKLYKEYIEDLFTNRKGYVYNNNELELTSF